MYQQTIAPPPFPAQAFAGPSPMPASPFPPAAQGFPPPPAPFAPAHAPFMAQSPFPPQPGFGPGPGMPGQPPMGFGPGPGAPFPPFQPAQNKNKMMFIIGGGVAAFVALMLILWASGVFGGGSSWIQGRWCAGNGTSLSFSSDGKVTSSATGGQPSTYTLDGNTLTITAPTGQSGSFTVTKTDSNTMSFGAAGGGVPMRRC